MKNIKHIILALALLSISKMSTAQFVGSSPIQQASPGNVAIGSPSYSPSSLLQVRGGSVLFDGTIGITPANGIGTRMMWIPSKSAFRAGAVTSSFLGIYPWDDGRIGVGSTAFGGNTTAAGAYSFAAGQNNISNGDYSTGFGQNNTINGISAFATGVLNGAYGNNSSAFGKGVTASSYCSFAIGQYNNNPGYNTTAWVSTDPIFTIGNGLNSNATSDALTVLKNGNVGIGVTNPDEKLVINGGMKMNYNSIYLASDHYHGLGYFNVYTTNGNYANKIIDGPVLFGYSGGALGTNQGVNRNIALSWLANGNVGIGTSNPGLYKLAVEGAFGARSIKVTQASWADFVFNDSYKLKSLTELEKFIKENKHLPEIQTACEIERDGLDMAEIIAKQMQKIEELTLYIIELNNNQIELDKKVVRLEYENKILIRK
jgi:hypothetical protein